MQVRVATEVDASGLLCETRTVYARPVHACQRCYCIRLLVHQNRKLHWTYADLVKEVRSLKHTYICNEERVVVALMQMEVGAQHHKRTAGARLLT